MTAPNTAYLVARRLFHHDDGNSTKATCPTDPADQAITPLFGSMTYHTFSGILSGACGLFSMLLVLVAIFRHATNYSSPIQQRQIIRILFLVPWVSLFAFLIVYFPNAGEYIVESLDAGCAIALSGFLLLLCDFVLSNPGGFDALFGPDSLNRGQFPADSPQWLKRCWYIVLQFIPTSIIIWIATAASVAAGTYCAASNNIHFAHIWITVFKMIVTGAAVIGTFRFAGRMKKELAPHKVFLKFFAFKGIIGVNVLQTFIINILTGHNVIKPTAHMTYKDLSIGLPSLILSCEMPIFAILMFIAFPASPYHGKPPGAGPLTAVVEALNITDLLSAFVRGPMRLVREQQRGIQRQHSMPLGNVSGSEGTECVPATAMAGHQYQHGGAV